MISALAKASIPPICAWKISSRSVEFLLILASKLTPPPANPPASRMISMAFGKFIQIHWELVGIPAILIIAPVGINTAEHTRICSYLQFMLESMSGQCCMVHFDIYFKIFIQIHTDAENQSLLHNHNHIDVWWAHRVLAR